jgi:hypothetical protein
VKDQAHWKYILQERSNNKRDDIVKIAIVRTSWVDGTVDQMDDSRAAEMVDETAGRLEPSSAAARVDR